MIVLSMYIYIEHNNKKICEKHEKHLITLCLTGYNIYIMSFRKVHFSIKSILIVVKLLNII